MRCNKIPSVRFVMHDAMGVCQTRTEMLFLVGYHLYVPISHIYFLATVNETSSVQAGEGSATYLTHMQTRSTSHEPLSCNEYQIYGVVLPVGLYCTLLSVACVFEWFGCSFLSAFALQIQIITVCSFLSHCSSFLPSNKQMYSYNATYSWRYDLCSGCIIILVYVTDSWLVNFR